MSVVGVPGAGKTTLGARLAETLGVPHVELDAIFHQPGWTELPTDAFRRRVADAVAAPGWVIDGNYRAVRELVWAAADTVVWLDRPRRTVMRRLLVRTARRAVTREELWNGNREPLTGMFRCDPHDNLLLWAWHKHPEYRRRYAAAMTDPGLAHLRFVRLTTDGEVEALLASVRRDVTLPEPPTGLVRP